MEIVEEVEKKDFKYSRDLDIQASMKDPLYMEARKKEINQSLSADMCKYLYTSGFLEFSSYEGKVAFLNSACSSFGLNLQGKNVKFVDADFVNLLGIKVRKSKELRVIDICAILNKLFGKKSSGITQVEVPDFMFYDASKEQMYTEILDGTLYVRFNSFDQLWKAQKAIEKSKVTK